MEDYGVPRLRRHRNWPERDVLDVCVRRALTLRRETPRPDNVFDLRV